MFAFVGALFVLAWVQVSQKPWRDIGYVRPKTWLRDLALGVLLGVALKLAMKAVVMPLLGAPAINQAYHYLAGNTAALPGAIFMMIAFAGFGEETVFRGFLFDRLGKVIGTTRSATVATVLITSALFSVAHLADQGIPGAEQAAVMGLVYGTAFAMTGSLWLPMVTHVAFNLTAVAIIYVDAESAVAQLFFR